MASPLYQYPDKPIAWNERDVLLFANSIGCSPESELHFLYELHPQFATFPTYPIVLTFKHDYTSTSSFQQHFSRHLTPPESFIPGFPRLDIRRVVDGERRLQVLQKLPTSSGARDFIIQSFVTGVWDKGKGKSTIVQTEHHVIEKSKSGTGIAGKRINLLYAKMSETAVFMEQGGWGGPNSPSPSPPPKTPSSAPTITLTHQIPSNAHLLYRLNGDYNPLHATSVSAAVVQPTPIMHGLYSWNVVAAQILRHFANSNPEALKSFRASFKAPVRPGDVLRTEIWSGEGAREVRFRTMVEGRVVLDGGVAGLVDVKRREKERL